MKKWRIMQLELFPKKLLITQLESFQKTYGVEAGTVIFRLLKTNAANGRHKKK